MESNTGIVIINRMKKYIVVLLSTVLLLPACKQNHPATSTAEKAYSLALRHGDVQAAINACYQILADDSTKTNYYDTLVYLYLNTQNQASTYLAAQECYKLRPTDEKILMLLADYSKSLGLPDTSLMYYGKLYQITHKLEYMYDMAQVNYNANRFDKAEVLADSIIANPNSANETVTLYADRNSEGQAVPLNAVAYHVKAGIYLTMGKKDPAVKYLNESIRLFPTFIIALKNKKDVDSGIIKLK